MFKHCILKDPNFDLVHKCHYGLCNETCYCGFFRYGDLRSGEHIGISSSESAGFGGCSIPSFSYNGSSSKTRLSLVE